MSVDVWGERDNVEELVDVCAGIGGYQGFTAKNGLLQLHRSLLALKQLKDAPEGWFRVVVGFAKTVREYVTSMRDEHVCLRYYARPISKFYYERTMLTSLTRTQK